MREPVYKSADEWRTVVIMNLVHLRQTIHELGFIVAVIAVGAFAGKWWEYAPITGAAIALVSAIVAYRVDDKDYQKLADIHFAADTD
jgi:hypothetical protein